MNLLKSICLWNALAATVSIALADQPSQTTSAILSCGGAYLRAQTTSVAHVGSDDRLIWTAQTITIRNGHGNAAHAVPIDTSIAEAAPVAKGGLPAIVSSWNCLDGLHQVVLLWLGCNRSDKGDVCHGQSEWQRLVDLNGRRLDSGYAPQDKRYKALMEKLGISMDGIHLKDAIGN